MQADLVLYLRAAGVSTKHNWYPVSLVYADRFAPFPIFARAESKRYFDRLAPALGAESLGSFKERVAALNSSGQGSALFDHRELPLPYLANVQHLGMLS